jgi:UDP-N-acetylmuramyl pentapeptide phosphotransferase/UDP-N-acetylglucosamine-1-phosphate transferase
MSTALLCLASFVLSALAVRAFLAFSRRRLLDRPGARSSHALPTPTGGGFPAALVGLGVTGLGTVLGLVAAGPRTSAVLLVVLVLAPVGLIDDARDLSRGVRYAAHLLVALGVVLLILPEPSAGGLFYGLIAALLLTGLINAVNFMDGIDALVAGTGAIALAFLGWQSGDASWLVFAAAYAGFALFNLPPARLFMGDAGSTTLGGLLGVALIAGRERLALADLVVLAPLLGDAAYTLLRRLGRGENVLQAHHSHLYQRLLRSGLSHGRISLGYALATLLAALLARAFGATGALVALGGCALAVLAIERHVAQRGVPFTRAVERRA